MRHSLPHAPQFYVTAPQPCPYLHGRAERKLFTALAGDSANELNNTLSRQGFRRSQNVLYRPSCESCVACMSARIRVSEFHPSRTQKRVARKNDHLRRLATSAWATEEHYDLFRAYLDARHSQGGMADMTVLDYAMMVEDTHVDTMLVEYRFRGPDSGITGQGEGPLIATALTDLLSDGLSMVYSFFAPEFDKRGLGNLLILDHIRQVRLAGLSYVYLGYWVNGSRKMNYKMRFLPQEHLGPKGWERFEG